MSRHASARLQPVHVPPRIEASPRAEDKVKNQKRSSLNLRDLRGGADCAEITSCNNHLITSQQWRTIAQLELDSPLKSRIKRKSRQETSSICGAEYCPSTVSTCVYMYVYMCMSMYVYMYFYLYMYTYIT